MKTCRFSLTALALVAIATAADAQQGIKLLIPNEATCSGFLAALDNGDREAMLSIGGWALGYLSGVAEQSGKDILRDTTSEALMDRIAQTCQSQPQREMSSVVIEIANSWLAGNR